MTNFPVHEFEGKHYFDVYGDGDDRFIIAHEEINRNKGNFGVEQAFDVLEKARHTSEAYPTVCSLVLDPTGLYVYIALFGYFSKIWRISLAESMIESFSGFDAPHKLKIGPGGILASELSKYR